MKKTLIAALAALLLAGICACGSKTPAATEAKTEAQTEAQTSAAPSGAEAEGDTLGLKYLAAFLSSEAEDADSCADELIALGALETELVKMEAAPGYLDGFTEEITGFTTGVKFSPMIGSIPFVGYVLESEDPQALLEQLNGSADPRWNICTEADEIVCDIRGSLVFFLMCSNEE